MVNRQAAINRLHNMSNPYQGPQKRVLCVCSAGLLRSPTTAFVLQRDYDFNTRACGVNVEYALIPMSYEMVYWADAIVFMEEVHKQTAVEAFPELFAEKQTFVLNIPDRFSRMDEQLVNLIENKVREVGLVTDTTPQEPVAA